MRSPHSGPSWQVRLIAALLSRRRIPFPSHLGTLRALLQFRLFRYDGCKSIRPGRAGRVPGEWVEPTGEQAAVLLYLHGGGYFSCSARSHRAITTAFASRGFKVFAPDYRLAPEHPFPAGLDDAVAAYRSLRSELEPAAPIVLGGDSAGGGLALATLLKLRDDGDTLPRATVLFSPLADLAVQVPVADARWTIPDAVGLASVRRWYLGCGDPRDPLASPIYGDLAGLPPVLIHVSADESLLQDSLRLAARSPNTFTIVKWPLVPHVWQLSHRFIPEGRHSLDAAARFLAQKVGEEGHRGESEHPPDGHRSAQRRER